MERSDAPSTHLICFTCWSCNRELTVPSHMAGVTGPCPCCGQILAAPVVAPTMALAPHSYQPEPTPAADSSSSSTSSGGGGGYRIPEAKPPAPAKPANTTHSENELRMLGVVGGVFAVIMGKLAVNIKNSLLRDVTDPIKRQVITWAIYGSCTVAYIIIGLFFFNMVYPEGRPTRSTPGRVAVGGNSSRARQIATLHSSIKAQDTRGQYTEADLAAADEAASDPSLSPQQMVDRYVGTLNGRAMNRQR